MTEPTTHTLDVPGAVLTYDVRRAESSDEPPLLLIGYPMAAAGFNSLAGYFTDRTVVTYDPRGSERSQRLADAPVTTPEIVADDLHRLISEIGGPVDLFASSGGAIDALALVAEHPEDVRLLVGHEPPTTAVLEDRQEADAVIRHIRDTYQRDGWAPAMAKFIAVVSYTGPIPADWSDKPAPDPQMFGLPVTEDDGRRDDPMFTAIVQTTSYAPDFDALRAASTKIVIAVGEESTGVMAGRGALGVAKGLGTEPVMFPGGHGGFLGGEYGQMGKPKEFAEKLREVLAKESVPALV